MSYIATENHDLWDIGKRSSSGVENLDTRCRRFEPFTQSAGKPFARTSKLLVTAPEETAVSQVAMHRIANKISHTRN
jgi:hypothetical protein